MNTWPATAYGSPGASRAGLVVVLMLHAMVFWALLRMEVFTLPAPLAVLNVGLLTPPAPEMPKPEIVPPKPRPVEKQPQPRPVPEPVRLAVPADVPVNVPVNVPAPPDTAPVAVAPAPTFASAAPPAPPAPPAAPTQPRFDADYLHNPKPAYPPLARRMGEEGRVVLRVRVGADGLPLDVAVATGSGSDRLDRAALDTVRRWKFVPARLGAEAVAASVLVPIVFSLKD
jgi:protein TonB